MSLLVRINLALGAVFVAATLISGYVCRNILETNAQREVFAEAGLLMDSALGIRDYTDHEIVPLISERIQTDFPPQAVPFYAATQNFLKIRERHPEYMYKEATLNPTNPRDRAVDWEADIVNAFRNDSNLRQLTGERDAAIGKSLFFAQPIRASPPCLQCHSTPDVAPPAMLARYHDAWDRAADRTPHGTPIELRPEDFDAPDASGQTTPR